MNKLKKFIQKGKRGFSDEDLYDVGWFICNIIASSLDEFANTDKCAIPMSYMNKAKKEIPNATYEQKEAWATKHWDADVQNIVQCFRAYLNENMPNPAFDKYWNVIQEKTKNIKLLDADNDEDLEKIFNYNDSQDKEVQELKALWIKQEQANDEYRKEKLHEGFELLEKHIEELWW